jgi:hypothetical protein
MATLRGLHSALLVRNVISRSCPSTSTMATMRRITSGAGLFGLLSLMIGVFLE